MTLEEDESFTAFVRARGEHHLRTAALLTGDLQAAEDLVQASLLKLYRAWPRLDTTADPDAYLRRIIVNTRRSWWRARWRRETPVAVIADVPDGAGGGDCPDRHVTGLLVRQVLAGLPSRQREVLVLRYCEDLPEADVAAMLGCSAGTVKTHARRGLSALRSLLGETGDMVAGGTARAGSGSGTKGP